jgi:hypothetical protein
MDMSVVLPTLMDNDEGDHFFGGVHFQALREGSWKLLKGQLAPPCSAGGGALEWDFLRMDPRGRVGATQLADDECADQRFTSLFDVSQSGWALATEKENVISRHRDLEITMGSLIAEIASKKGQAETFELTPEQEQKLKSLGYLR